MAGGSLVLVRFGAEAPVGGVMSRVVYALGARTGISIERLDELGMAVEVAAQAREASELSVEAEVVEDGLEVRLSPVSGAAMAHRQAVLSALVDRAEIRGDEVRLGIRT
jgi:hypothetical protein